MRLSVQTGDPGQREWLRLSHGGRTNIAVYLDGVKQPNNVITCDDKEGYILRFVLDERGRRQKNPKRPSEVLTEEVRGHVAIKISQPAPVIDTRDHAANVSMAQQKRERRLERNRRLTNGDGQRLDP